MAGDQDRHDGAIRGNSTGPICLSRGACWARPTQRVDQCVLALKRPCVGTPSAVDQFDRPPEQPPQRAAAHRSTPSGPVRAGNGSDERPPTRKSSGEPPPRKRPPLPADGGRRAGPHQPRFPAATSLRIRASPATRRHRAAHTGAATTLVREGNPQRSTAVARPACSHHQRFGHLGWWQPTLKIAGLVGNPTALFSCVAVAFLSCAACSAACWVPHNIRRNSPVAVCVSPLAANLIVGQGAVGRESLCLTFWACFHRPVHAVAWDRGTPFRCVRITRHRADACLPPTKDWRWKLKLRHRSVVVHQL